MEPRQNPLHGIGDKPVLSLVEGTCWTKPLSGIYLFAMGIVKRQECWERVGTDEPWEQEDLGRVAVREFRDTDEALE